MEKDLAADGLRGFAAMNVVLCHFLISLFPLGFVYLYPGAASPQAAAHFADAIISSPGISILWNGNFAVCVFFVLSGYVLTKAFVETGDITSMKLRAARRYLRLSMPIFGSVMLSYLILAAGLKYSGDAARLSQSVWLEHFWKFDPSFTTALREGTYRALLFGTSGYTPILWTMRIEFIGSMIVFGFRALNPGGLAGWINAAVLVGVLFAFFPTEWMLYAGFVAGSYLGQMGHGQKRPIVLAALAVAIICGGFDYSRWYAWTGVIPLQGAQLKHLVNTVGAIALLYAVRAGSFERILKGRLAQYIGRVSYAIYLVHFPLLLSFSSWLFLWLVADGIPYTAAAMIDLAATVLVVLATATAFHATFDRLGIALSRRIFRAPASSEPRMTSTDSRLHAPGTIDWPVTPAS